VSQVRSESQLGIFILALALPIWISWELKMRTLTKPLLSLLFMLALASSYAHATLGKRELSEDEIIAELRADYKANPFAVQAIGPKIWGNAAIHNHVKVLQWLNQHKITGRDQIYDLGTNLWHFAAGAGSIGALEWLHRNKIPGRYVILDSGHELREFALVLGKLDVVQWLAENFEWDDEKPAALNTPEERRIVSYAIAPMFYAFQSLPTLVHLLRD
jgi:hypothetical protein